MSLTNSSQAACTRRPGTLSIQTSTGISTRKKYTARWQRRQTVTPDNCKVAVTENKDWINPSVNKVFQSWAEHNGTVIMPAKVRKPRLKPNIEGHVKIVTMHILIEMEEMTFYSPDELNAELWRRMEQENRENFQGLSYSRRDLFESEEKDALLPLPDTQYEYLERKNWTESGGV